ncbi:MAG: hypothetical protein II951_09140 [Bacteroidales bacterium]|nr:hypothetical protein [Bacteroidales bacterium]
MKKSIIALLVVILAVTGLMYWVTNEKVMTREVTEMMYGEQLQQQGKDTKELVDIMYEQQHKWWVPIMIGCVLAEAGKIFFWTTIVFAGFYSVSKKKYFEIFPAAVVAETAKALQAVAAGINFVYFNPPTSIAKLSTVPFSLASFFDVDKLDMWMVQVLSAVNIFELLYIVLFAWYLSKDLNEPMGKMSKIVLYTYGLLSVLIIAGMASATANMPQIGK